MLAHGTQLCQSVGWINSIVNASSDVIHEKTVTLFVTISVVHCCDVVDQNRSNET